MTDAAWPILYFAGWSAGALMLLIAAVTLACLFGGLPKAEPDFSKLTRPDRTPRRTRMGPGQTQYVPETEIALAMIEAAQAIEEVHRLTDPEACGEEVYRRLIGTRPDGTPTKRPGPLVKLFEHGPQLMAALRRMAVVVDPAALLEVGADAGAPRPTRPDPENAEDRAIVLGCLRRAGRNVDDETIRLTWTSAMMDEATRLLPVDSHVDL